MAVPLICAYLPCSNPFTAFPSQVKAGRKYCSTACGNLAANVPLADRFWSKVQICDHGLTCQICCWPWQGSLHHNGYGQFQVRENGKLLHDGAHLASFFLYHGRWPGEGLQALHTCDFPACASFWHIWEGNQTDNMEDCVRKGRNGHVTKPERLARGDRSGLRVHRDRAPRGQRNANWKMSDVEWTEAFALWQTGEWTQTALGKRYGVSQHAIWSRLKHQP